MLLSIVIPVHRDAAPLEALLDQLAPDPEVQLIVSVSDAGDEALHDVLCKRPDVIVVRGPAGRGGQMNAGATAGGGRWLWFVHADSQVPAGFVEIFRGLDADASLVGGAFRFGLASNVWQARVWERGVALRVWLFGLPYGDQGLFVRRPVFQRMGGFRSMPLMEDVEFVGRLKREGPVRHLKVEMRTSARRWEAEGWWRRSLRNLGLLALYYVGVPPERLARRYTRGKRDS